MSGWLELRLVLYLIYKFKGRFFLEFKIKTNLIIITHVFYINFHQIKFKSFHETYFKSNQQNKKKKGKLHFLYILNVISYHKFSN